MGRRRSRSTSTSVEIAAPPEAVWEVLADVTSWPGRTASMSSVELLGAMGLGPGARVRIRQPGLPAMVWRVVSWRPDESFAWVTSSPGVRTLGTHSVTAAGKGRSTLSLGIHHRGLLAPLARLLTGRLTRRYVELEAAAHKAEAEARWGAARSGEPGEEA